MNDLRTTIEVPEEEYRTLRFRSEQLKRAAEAILACQQPEQDGPLRMALRAAVEAFNT